MHNEAAAYRTLFMQSEDLVSLKDSLCLFFSISCPLSPLAHINGGGGFFSEGIIMWDRYTVHNLVPCTRTYETVGREQIKRIQMLYETRNTNRTPCQI